MSTAESSWKPDALSPAQIGLVRLHLKEVVASHAFAGSKRTQDFLHLIVEHALEGEVDSLRERMIGAEMFGRPVDYDTGSDSVVRVKATEVRKRLSQYYLEKDEMPAVRIELPSGSYVPKFTFVPMGATAQPKTEDGPLTSGQQTIAHGNGQPVELPAARVEEAPFPPAQKPRRSPRMLVGVAIGLALIGLAGFAGFEKWTSDSHARQGIRSIAILPLKNLSGDPGQEFFADGMTEELINDLGQVSTLRVISLTSAMSYKGTKKKLPEIARELAVDGVVEGSVEREGNQVRISAQLIDARADRPIWAHTYVRGTTSVLDLQGEVAKAIADEIRITVTPQEKARLARGRPIDPEAQDSYLHGMLGLDADDCKSAIEYFNQALAKDPNYAQAHAALANCYGRLGESGQMAYKDAFSRQKSEATRAIELDDSLPEGHAELANTAMTLDWDWAAAATEFHRALELNPSSAPTHDRYAMYLARKGEFPEAIAEIREGMKLDPVSGRSYKEAASIYYFSRQFDKALALDQDSFQLGRVDVEKGMYAQSIRNFLRAGDNPHNWGHLGNAYARSGQVDSARKYISRLKANVRRNGVGRYEIALIYAGLSDKNEAFQWLEESYRAHDVGLTYLKIDPCLAGLRSDARYNSLLRRVGLMQ